MAASYQFIIETGTVVADTSSLLADVQAEYQTALGAAIDTNSATPQGTLMAGETIARASVMKNNSDLANVINPDQSYGVFLDAICAFNGIRRGQNNATDASGVQLVGDGLNTVVVSAGSRVQTAAGDLFVLQADVTITNGKTATGEFLSVAYGNIPFPVGSLTIVDGTIGWGAANCLATTIVTPGTVQLTDPQLKIARNQRLAIQGVGGSGAIAAAVSQVPNVTSVNVIENNTGQFANAVNGITFTLPNAMWFCVAGSASDQQIADAAYAAHQGGCPWDYGAAGQGTPVQSPNGVQVTDPVTGLKYYVKFTRAIKKDTYVRISVRQNSSVSSPVPSVQSAIVNYATGQEQGEPGLIAGASVSAYEMAGAVARQLPGMYIKKCSVAVVPAGSAAPGDSAFTDEVVLNPWEQGVIQTNNIAVTVVA